MGIPIRIVGVVAIGATACSGKIITTTLQSRSDASVSERRSSAKDASTPSTSVADSALIAPTMKSCSGAMEGTLAYPLMFSAYDGVHQFQAWNFLQGEADYNVRWSASDPSIVSFAQGVDAAGGIVITTLKPGSVTITAQARDGACGTAELHIEEAKPADWEIGDTRFNNGQPLPPIADPPTAPAGNSNPLEANGARPACSHCHSPLFEMGPPHLESVPYTPEQTAGDTDLALQGAFQFGRLPPDAYFDPSALPLDVWRAYHSWTLTQDEARGLVVYLRSLEPRPQARDAIISGFKPPKLAPEDSGVVGGRDAATD